MLELDDTLLRLSCEGKSLVKKQLSSVVLAALQGLGEHRSPNTLVWSLSSVITLLKLLLLEKRQLLWPVEVLRMAEQSMGRWRSLLLLLMLPGNTKTVIICKRKFVSSLCVQFSSVLWGTPLSYLFEVYAPCVTSHKVLQKKRLDVRKEVEV